MRGFRSPTRGRPLPRSIVTTLSLLVVQIAAGSPPIAVTPNPLRVATRSDAELADVCFVDAQHGWAAGDRGAIWQTSDGGQHWNLQNTPVSCRLASICFLNDRTGWAAGGFTQRFTHATRGILLRTDDGGITWVVWQRDSLPALSQIQFFNRQQGIALGSPSTLYPHGLLFTEDGGRSWTPIRGSAARRWLCGDFLDFRRGCVAGKGLLAVLADRELEPATGPAAMGDDPILIRLTDEGIGYALTRQREFWVSSDGGLQWRNASETNPLPTGFTPHTMAARGRQIWIAGSPGSVVLQSADAGRHWQLQNTGQSLPLRGLHFVDERRGWAVGALGTILHTSDGGKTWNLQQGVRRRAAILGVFATARQVPLEFFARLSAGEGYTSAVCVIGRESRVSTTPYDVPGQRTREALIESGVTAVDQPQGFPLPPEELQLPASRITRQWSLGGNSPTATLEHYLSRQIRIWRPDVLLTLPARPRDGDPLALLLNQALLRAVDRAAKTGNDSMGLVPWQVSKVYSTLPPRSVSSLHLSGSRLIPQLGCTLTNFVAPGRSLLERWSVEPAPLLGFALLLSTLPQGQGLQDFCSGLYLPPGGDARRKQIAALLDITRLRHSTKKTEILRAIIASAGIGQPSPAAWRAQIHQAAEQLSPQLGGEVLFEVAGRYHREGKWQLAAETLAVLVNHCPNHPLVGRAAQWLVQYHSSGEARQRESAAERPRIRQVRAELPVISAPSAAPPEKIAGQGRSESPQPPAALSWVQHLRRTDPALAAEPSIQLPLAATHRRTGNLRQAERIYLTMERSAWLGAYASCGAAERSISRRLAGKMQLPSKPLWVCRKAEAKPFLDGRLDEACWLPPRGARDAAQEGQLIKLRSRYTENGPATTIQACFDSEYLYFGIQCSKAPGIDYPHTPAARPRDAPLGGDDRVDILIDIDRDYATYYRLSLDHRGRTHDSCWHDASWNPEWFVAATATGNSWTCEVAIPLKELSGQARTAERIWACGVQRTIPGSGFQSWTEPASPEVDPSGFGHLLLPVPMH
jgi:photosystem II stability/assembly factor-like uncharacterized protein